MNNRIRCNNGAEKAATSSWSAEAKEHKPTDAPVDKSQNWQESTNSIFCSKPLDVLGQQMEARFNLEPRLRGQLTRRRIRNNCTCAPPRGVTGDFALLTKWKSAYRISEINCMVYAFIKRPKRSVAGFTS